MMRSLDRLAIERAGIPGAVLMENAGRAVFEVIRERYGPLRNLQISVCAGLGNNGGDGFVAARHLQLAGAVVTLRIAGDPGSLKGEAAVQYGLVRGVPERCSEIDNHSDLKVDALLGTGSSGAPREKYAEAIRWMNETPGPTIAVDIPSGIDSDNGAAPGEAVRAALTVTFGYPKLGLFMGHGPECANEVIVDEIGFDWNSLDCRTLYRWLRRDELSALLPARPRDGHKGLFGHVLVVGGSRGMSGAPAMTARAALRSGAGLVTAAVPETIQATVAARSDEVMTIAVSDRDGALRPDAMDAILNAAKRADVLCVGPGVGQSEDANKLVLRLPPASSKPLVLDADGLNALASEVSALDTRTSPAVLTPHPGECARLLGTDTESVQGDRIGAVRAAAEKFRSIVVLKGAHTLIADGRSTSGEIPISINTTGNPGMATGGSGDSLTGIIGALIGQKLDAYDAACLGVYLHGRAGDLSAAAKGEVGMIAGDIIEQIPYAIQETIQF